MKKRVLVIISTYNGERNLVRQLDSIFNQIGVNVSVFIRDDHSVDNTVEIINNYIIDNPDKDLSYIVGENEGYAKSFWDALCLSPEADYYAFSDQDDVWKEDKLIKTIQPMEDSEYSGPKLSYCKMIRSDTNLNVLEEQVNVLIPRQLTKKITLTQTYNYGAATIINKEAKSLVCRCWPKQNDIPHDLWVGAVCYWFGQIYYVDEELYYWIRYNTSVTGEGTKKSGVKYRIKKSIRKQSYPNFSDELLRYYSDLLLDEDEHFLRLLSMCKKKIVYRIKLLFDKDFKRINRGGTVALKIGVLLGWY